MALFGSMFWPMIALITIASLSFVAVVTWIGNRTKEREEYYRQETLKKIAESGTSEAALEYLRETDRIAQQHLRGGLQLGGLITGSAGIGLMVFLRAIEPNEGIYWVGLIPLLVGVVLFGYALTMPAK
jgi:hypothetical protein